MANQDQTVSIPASVQAALDNEGIFASVTKVNDIKFVVRVNVKTAETVAVSLDDFLEQIAELRDDLFEGMQVTDAIPENAGVTLATIHALLSGMARR